jgi:hypothetical protein
MAKVSAYPNLVASAIDRTADFLYVEDATGPSGKRATPQALFDANLQGTHTLLGNLTLDGGSLRTMALVNLTSFSASTAASSFNLNGSAQIVGPLELFTPLVDAGGLSPGMPVILYDASVGRVDFGNLPEQFTTGVVGTLTTSRSVSNADNGETLYYTGASNITLTIPSGLVPGWWCRVVQGGVGKVTFAGSGVTVSGKQGHLSTGGQWHVVEARRLTTSQYLIHGETAN